MVGDFIGFDFVNQLTNGYCAKSFCHIQIDYYRRLSGVSSLYDFIWAISHAYSTRVLLKKAMWASDDNFVVHKICRKPLFQSSTP